MMLNYLRVENPNANEKAEPCAIQDPTQSTLALRIIQLCEGPFDNTGFSLSRTQSEPVANTHGHGSLLART